MFVVIKGASVARTVYVEPCLRSFGDLDLLVRTADYGRACALLGRLGHERQRPEPRPGFEVRFGKASVHRHPEDRIEVDLHRTLVLGPFGLWIDPEELLNRRQTFDVAGRSIGRLDDTGMLLERRDARVARPLRSPTRSPPRCRPDSPSGGRGLGRAGFVGATVASDRGDARRPIDSVADPGRNHARGSASAPRIGRLRRARSSVQAYQGERRFLGGTSSPPSGRSLGSATRRPMCGRSRFPIRFLLARSNGTGKATYRRRWSIPMRWARSRIKRSTRRIRSRSAAGSGGP